MWTLKKDYEFNMQDCKRRAEEENLKWLDRAYELGYEKGYQKAINECGNSKDGIANLVKATADEVQKYGTELIGWCSKCNKPIEGRWIGVSNFCPWCGRPWLWKEDKEE